VEVAIDTSICGVPKKLELTEQVFVLGMRILSFVDLDNDTSLVVGVCR
jgi:hypothetical protein